MLIISLKFLQMQLKYERKNKKIIMKQTKLLKSNFTDVK